VVEVDGDVHDLQKEEDERREKALGELGLRIVRFKNDEVVREVVRGGGGDQEIGFVESVNNLFQVMLFMLFIGTIFTHNDKFLFI